MITINYCVNYGGRAEIVEAAREIAPRRGRRGKLDPERISEATFAQHLHRPTFPTSTCSSGRRGSSERATSCCGRRPTPSIVFQDKLWPDYDRRDLWAACEEYVNRNRRFGGAG